MNAIEYMYTTIWHKIHHIQWERKSYYSLTIVSVHVVCFVVFRQWTYSINIECPSMATVRGVNKHFWNTTIFSFYCALENLKEIQYHKEPQRRNHKKMGRQIDFTMFSIILFQMPFNTTILSKGSFVWQYFNSVHVNVHRQELKEKRKNHKNEVVAFPIINPINWMKCGRSSYR